VIVAVTDTGEEICKLANYLAEIWGRASSRV
jgi:hypothetical protein